MQYRCNTIAVISLECAHGISMRLLTWCRVAAVLLVCSCHDRAMVVHWNCHDMHIVLRWCCHCLTRWQPLDDHGVAIARPWSSNGWALALRVCCHGVATLLLVVAMWTPCDDHDVGILTSAGMAPCIALRPNTNPFPMLHVAYSAHPLYPV